MKKHVILVLTVILMLISCSRQKHEEPTWYANDSLASLTENDKVGEENLLSDMKETPTVEVEETPVIGQYEPPRSKDPEIPEFSTFVQDYKNNGYDLSYLIGKYIFSWEMGSSPEYIEITHNEETQEYEITWYRHVDYKFYPGLYDVSEDGITFTWRDEFNWDLRNQGPFETIIGVLKKDDDDPSDLHIVKKNEEAFPDDIHKYSLYLFTHSYNDDPSNMKIGEIETSTNGNPKGHYHLESDFSLYQEWRESQKK